MVRGPMFLMLSKHPRKQNRTKTPRPAVSRTSATQSKHPRKQNRTKTKRFRAKLAAKNRARRDRIYVRAK